jgi:hypothetical protein
MNDNQNAEMAAQPTIIEFEGKGTDVMPIEMNLLSKSVRRETGLAGIRSIPRQYWKFFELIITMLEANEVNYTVEKIMIQNNSSKAYLTDEDKEAGYTPKRAPINKWRFDKIISLIQLNNLTAEETSGSSARNMAIGITLNKEGLSVAFGANVWACNNFNVMGGTVLRSYGHRGDEGLGWDNMKYKLENWISKLGKIWSVQNEIMEAMKAESISSSKVVDRIIGNLYLGALKQAYFKGNAMPFNTHELSSFGQEAIRQAKEEDRITNVWDLYNWGTSIMKPGIMDIGEIATNSNMWAEYLCNEFFIEKPNEIIEAEIVE